MSHEGYEDRTGSRVEKTDLTGAVIRDTYLNDARIELCDCRGMVIRGSLLIDVTMSGEVRNLVVNEIDVAPYVEAELDRKYPERPKMRPTDAAGFREAWDILERLWAGTVDRARALPGEALHQHVDGEWSFIQTLRHLVFATDSWVRRALLGEPSPYDPLDLPFDDMAAIPGVPWDRDARPTLDEVLALRADRQAVVRRVLEGLTDEQLASRTTPVTGSGYPPPDSYPVHEVLATILNEEWWHRRFAERDLAVLEAAS
jgi:uncharacterized damage-inducible protein DinB